MFLLLSKTTKTTATSIYLRVRGSNRGRIHDAAPDPSH